MDRRDLFDAAKRAGWSISKKRSGHLKLVSPNGDVVFTASTPSDWRGTMNLAAQLRKLGLEVR